MGSLLTETEIEDLLNPENTDESLVRRGLLDINDLADPDAFMESMARVQGVSDDIALADSLGLGGAPDPVTFGQGFASGLSGGFFGEEPDEFFSRAQLGELAGDAVLFGILFSIGGALLGGAGATGSRFAVKSALDAGKSKVVPELIERGVATTFDNTAVGATKGLLAGTSFSAITEEEDANLIPLLMVAGSVEGLLPAILSARKAKKVSNSLDSSRSKGLGDDVLPDGKTKASNEVSEDLFAVPDNLGTPEVIERELINVPNLPKGKVRENIEKLVVVSRKLDDFDKKFFEQDSLKIKNFQFGKDEMGFHRNLSSARQIAKEELDKMLLQDFKGSLSSAERKILDDLLPDNEILGKAEATNIIKNRLDRFQLEVLDQPFKSTTNVMNRVKEFNLKLDRMQQAIVVNLSPTASLDNIMKETDKLVTLNERGAQLLANSKTRQALLKEGTGYIDDFIKAVKAEGLAPELAATGELIDFGKRVGKFLNPQDTTLRTQNVTASIKELVNNNKKFIDRMNRDLRRAFNDDKPVRDSIGAFEEKILNTTMTGKDITNFPRAPIVRYIKGELDDINLANVLPDAEAQKIKLMEGVKTAGTKEAQDDIVAQLKELKESITQQFFSDEQLANQIIGESNNPLLRRANLLYKASLGDKRAVHELRGIQEASLSNTVKDAVVGQMVINNVDSFKGSAKAGGRTKTSGGGRGGKKPPNDPPSAGDDVGKYENVEQVVAEMAEAKRPWAFLERQLRPLSRIFANRAIRTKSPVMKSIYEKGEKLIRDTFLAENKILKDKDIIYKPLLLELDRAVNSIKSSEGRESALRFIDDVSNKVNTLIDEKKTTEQINKEITNMVKAQPEEVQKVYNSFRKLTDKIHDETNKAIDNMNEMIEAGIVPGKKLEPLQYRPGYVPFIYDGAFTIQIMEDVVNEAGELITKTVWTDFVHDSKGALKSLNKYFDGSSTTKGRIVIKPRYITSEEEGFVLGNLLDDVDKIYGRPAVEIRDLLKGKKLTSDNLNDVFFGNQLKRTLNLQEKRLDTIQALNLLIHNNQRFQNYTPLFRRMQPIRDSFKDRGFTSESEALTVFYDDLIGRSRSSEQFMDGVINNVINKVYENPASARVLNMLGVKQNSRVVRSVASTLNLFGRLSVLGFNPSSALINSFIIPTNVAPTIGIRNTFFGLRHFKDAVRTGSKTNQFADLFSHLGLDVRPTSFGFRETVNSAILEKGTSKYLEILDSWGMAMFNSSENTARGVTAIGAVNQAKQMARKLAKEGIDLSDESLKWQEKRLIRIADELGRPLDDQLTQFEYARFIVDKTNFRFTLGDTPELLRQPILKPMMQFKSFMVKEMDLFLFDAEFTARERFMAFGMLGALGGTMAMPFVEDLDRIGLAMFGISPKLWMEQNFPEIVAIGAGSAFGVDFSQRANFADIASFTANPFGIGAPRIASGVKSLADGNTAGAMDKFLPVGINNFLDGIELINTGEVRSSTTGKVKVSSEDVSNPLAGIFRLGGFKTPNEMKANRRLHVARSMRKSQNEMKRTALNLYLNAIDDGDMASANRIRKDNSLSAEAIKRGQAERNMSRKELTQRTLGKELLKTHPELLEDLE